MTALKEKCKNDNVPEEIILKKCKVKKFEDLSNKVYSNVVNNWDQVLEIARSSNS